jgi:hypothetical protein
MEVSILNLVPIRKGSDAKGAIDAAVRLAKFAEEIDIKRYWVAEHHNMKNLASSATQLLITHILEHTKSLCVGSGGVMLPNHSPYSIAEQYAALETLFPKRIDLGIGRAPGTDSDTAEVLRRGAKEMEFDMQISELIDYLRDKKAVKAYPVIENLPPIYILGSSVYSAYIAAEFGLPYAFASHFAPKALEKAIEVYRQNFKSSSFLAAPYVIAGANVVIAETDELAKSLATTQTQFFLNVVTGVREYLQPPKHDNDEVFASANKTGIEAPHFGPIDFSRISLKNREISVTEEMMECSFIGSKQSVKEQILEFQNRLDVDEIMAQSLIFDEKAQFDSFRALKEIVNEI